MNVLLSRDDFQSLVRLIHDLPEFANVRDRRRLITMAFEGVPNNNSIVARLDLDGSPMTVAGEVVHLLTQYGQVAYQKESLGVFLNYIEPLVGSDRKDVIAKIFRDYPLDGQQIAEKPIIDWRGNDNATEIKEKIIGENTLLHINTLEKAINSAKAVLHIKVAEKGYGTGFLVAPNLLMTNNHVIDSIESATSAEYNFSYQLDINGIACPVITSRFQEGGLYYSNRDLDFTVLQLETVPAGVQPLKIKESRAEKNQRVAIIQHPGGHFKKISMQNNFVQYANEVVVQYTTSTEPGSSGSPVFNNEYEVIAIHHSGGLLLEPGSGNRFLRNEGISMLPILQDLKQNSPSIFRSLYEATRATDYK